MKTQPKTQCKIFKGTTLIGYGDIIDDFDPVLRRITVKTHAFEYFAIDEEWDEPSFDWSIVLDENSWCKCILISRQTEKDGTKTISFAPTN